MLVSRRVYGCKSLSQNILFNPCEYTKMDVEKNDDDEEEEGEEEGQGMEGEF